MKGLYSESSPKTKLLLTVKRNGEPSLSELSQILGISKAAVLKHISELEREGMLERTYVPSGKGRPVCKVFITEKGHNVLPKSYSSLALEALEYVEKNLGLEGVSEVLHLRSAKILEEYRKTIEPMDESLLVDNLRTLRNSDGYMAEIKKLSERTFELCEYNCPILQISEKYSEACNSERELFQDLLGAEIESTHRIISGAKTCRFVIKFQEKY